MAIGWNSASGQQLAVNCHMLTEAGFLKGLLTTGKSNHMGHMGTSSNRISAFRLRCYPSLKGVCHQVDAAVLSDIDNPTVVFIDRRI